MSGRAVMMAFAFAKAAGVVERAWSFEELFQRVNG
jgi:hypothetical protein